ncbi:MAG: GNAT family N-acetyltransferase [Alphaproteobacteria bacterium]
MKIKTRFPNERDLDAQAVKQLCMLVNDVYDDAERGLWKVSDSRTNAQEIEKLLREKALILAEKDGRIVGSAHVQPWGKDAIELGMLVADRQYRNCGIGSSLMEAIEAFAHRKNVTIIRLELLTPRTWLHPSKEFLKNWYTRLGFCPETVEFFEKMHPEKAAHLATECDFTVWIKRLG